MSEIVRTEWDGSGKASTVLTKCRLLFVVFLLVCPCLPASGEIQIRQINQSIVSVHSYSGAKEVGAGIGFVVTSDIYNGFVVTSAEVLNQAETITVSIPGSEAQLVARNLLEDDSLGLAVLKVNGLNVPVLRFAKEQVEEGDSVWSAGIRADRGRTVGVSKGSISRRYVVPGIGSTVRMLMHNASLGESGLGSPLLNECGEIVGFSVSSPGDASGVAYAMQAGSLDLLLTGQNINIEPAKDICLSAIAQARQSADQAAERAREAKVEAVKAMTQANELTRRVIEVTQKNENLVKQTWDAQQRSAKAIKDAAAASLEVKTVREEVTRRTREIMTETQSLFELMQSESIRREQDLQKALAEQKGKAEIWERLLLGGLVLLFVLLVMAVFYLRKRDERQPDHKVLLDSPKTQLQRANTTQYVLDGEDRDGVRYLLRIASDQLESRDGVVIGRNPPDSPFVINHTDVSRQHVRMRLVKDRLFIEDLHSTNGTVVNGQSINEQGAITMSDGDQIILGSVVLRLRSIR
jgi:hypothetical protein